MPMALYSNALSACFVALVALPGNRYSIRVEPESIAMMEEELSTTAPELFGPEDAMSHNVEGVGANQVVTEDEYHELVGDRPPMCTAGTNPSWQFTWWQTTDQATIYADDSFNWNGTSSIIRYDQEKARLYPETLVEILNRESDIQSVCSFTGLPDDFEQLKPHWGTGKPVTSITGAFDFKYLEYWKQSCQFEFAPQFMAATCAAQMEAGKTPCNVEILEHCVHVEGPSRRDSDGEAKFLPFQCAIQRALQHRTPISDRQKAIFTLFDHNSGHHWTAPLANAAFARFDQHWDHYHVIINVDNHIDGSIGTNNCKVYDGETNIARIRCQNWVNFVFADAFLWFNGIEQKHGRTPSWGASQAKIRVHDGATNKYNKVPDAGPAGTGKIPFGAGTKTTYATPEDIGVGRDAPIDVILAVRWQNVWKAAIQKGNTKVLLYLSIDRDFMANSGTPWGDGPNPELEARAGVVQIIQTAKANGITFVGFDMNGWPATGGKPPDDESKTQWELRQIVEEDARIYWAALNS